MYDELGEGASARAFRGELMTKDCEVKSVCLKKYKLATGIPKYDCHGS